MDIFQNGDGSKPKLLPYIYIFGGINIHSPAIYFRVPFGVFPILQDRPDFVAPMAAHHAAALDRVWWLERCGATPGRPGQPPLLYIYICIQIMCENQCS